MSTICCPILRPVVDAIISLVLFESGDALQLSSCCFIMLLAYALLCFLSMLFVALLLVPLFDHLFFYLSPSHAPSNLVLFLVHAFSIDDRRPSFLHLEFIAFAGPPSAYQWHQIWVLACDSYPSTNARSTNRGCRTAIRCIYRHTEGRRASCQ